MVNLIIATLVGNVLSVIGAGVILFIDEKRQENVMPWLLSFATGTMLCTAFAGMLPKAVYKGEASDVMLTVMGGILLFFLLEKTMIWRHCHKKDCKIHSAGGYIVTIGDSVHNFMDGIAMAAAFSNSVTLGIGTTIAIFAHELPQEVGDFAVLINSGFSKKKAIIWNVLSGFAAILGGILSWIALDLFKFIIPYALAFSASSLIYVSMSDLIPSMRNPEKTGLKHFIALLAGVIIMLCLIS
jgi:zinc and cadmium transporter